ncbi:MAG: acyl-CoA dehydrogenase family protein [Ilumatobacteraceae bacterium]
MALTEPSGKWDESGVTMEASGSGDSVTLTGTKSFVLDGHTASLIIVPAKTAAGISLFAVAGDAAGLTRTPLSTMDQTRKQAKLKFSETPAKLIGTDGDGWNVISKVLDLVAVGLAAEQVGGAQKVLEMAVEYAKVRVQFGRLICLCSRRSPLPRADMLLEVEVGLARSPTTACGAAEMNDELPRSLPRQGVLLRGVLPRHRREHQIHGGIGFTWGAPGPPVPQAGQELRLPVGDLTPTTASAGAAHRYLILDQRAHRDPAFVASRWPHPGPVPPAAIVLVVVGVALVFAISPVSLASRVHLDSTPSSSVYIRTRAEAVDYVVASQQRRPITGSHS